MERQVFVVNAMTVDANDAVHILDGYPKTFDSKNYQNNVEKAKRRADGDASSVWAEMCKSGDTRKKQTVTLETIDGYPIYQKTMGPLTEPDEA